MCHTLEVTTLIIPIPGPEKWRDLIWVAAKLQDSAHCTPEPPLGGAELGLGPGLVSYLCGLLDLVSSIR